MAIWSYRDCRTFPNHAQQYPSIIGSYRELFKAIGTIGTIGTIGIFLIVRADGVTIGTIGTALELSDTIVGNRSNLPIGAIGLIGGLS